MRRQWRFPDSRCIRPCDAVVTSLVASQHKIGSSRPRNLAIYLSLMRGQLLLRIPNSKFRLLQVTAFCSVPLLRVSVARVHCDMVVSRTPLRRREFLCGGRHCDQTRIRYPICLGKLWVPLCVCLDTLWMRRLGWAGRTNRLLLHCLGLKLHGNNGP